MQVSWFLLWLWKSLKIMTTRWVRSDLSGVDIPFKNAGKSLDQFWHCWSISLDFRYFIYWFRHLSWHWTRKSRWQTEEWTLWSMSSFQNSFRCTSTSSRSWTNRQERISSDWKRCWITKRSTQSKKRKLRIMLREGKSMLRSLRTFWMKLTKISFSDLIQGAFCLLMDFCWWRFLVSKKCMKIKIIIFHIFIH